VLIIFLLQILILTFGNIAFRCRAWGVGIIGWLICIAFGSIGLIWCVLLKTIDEEKIKCPALGKREPTTEELNRGGSLSLRRLSSRGRRPSQAPHDPAYNSGHHQGSNAVANPPH